MSKRSGTQGGWVREDERLFTLEVSLIQGFLTDEFVDENPVVGRTIEIRGDQTLQELHRAIFRAYDREEEHMYEFQVGGEGPMDPDATRYVLPMAISGPFADETEGVAGCVGETPVGSIGLEVDDTFLYWFDFGDSWWHRIDVASIEQEAPPGDYPKVTDRVGESPPQYANWDDEE